MKNIIIKTILVFMLMCLSLLLFFITLDLVADDTTVTKISSKAYNFINQYTNEPCEPLHFHQQNFYLLNSQLISSLTCTLRMGLFMSQLMLMNWIDQGINHFLDKYALHIYVGLFFVLIVNIFPIHLDSMLFHRHLSMFRNIFLNWQNSCNFLPQTI